MSTTDPSQGPEPLKVGDHVVVVVGNRRGGSHREQDAVVTKVGRKYGTAETTETRWPQATVFYLDSGYEKSDYPSTAWVGTPEAWEKRRQSLNDERLMNRLGFAFTRNTIRFPSAFYEDLVALVKKHGIREPEL